MTAIALSTINLPAGLEGQEDALPAVFLPNEEAADRFFGFFTANHRNPNTRRAYFRATCRFSKWCERRKLAGLDRCGRITSLPISRRSGVRDPMDRVYQNRQ
jgi:hypothetical protein